MSAKRVSPPKTNLKHGALTAAVLLIATVAMASGYGDLDTPPGGASPVPPPAITPTEPLRPSQGHGQAVSLSAALDRTRVLQGGDGIVRMQLTLEGEERDAQGEVVPSDLIVVLDRSGSMSGEKWNQAKAATQELIDQLGRQDRFSLVTYESGVRLEIPLATAEGHARDRWAAIVAGLQTAGGTNMSAGLDTAHRHLSQHRAPNRAARVILISDGQANQGDASLDGLSRRAGNAARNEYVLSTVGVGLGFNEELMTRLANVGTGNFYFVQEDRALAGVFKDEFESARSTVASGLAVRIRPTPGVTVEDAAGYILERHGDETVFRPGTLFAGQRRTIWVRYRVPTRGGGEVALGTVRADYTDGDVRQHASLAGLPPIARVRDEGEFFAGINEDVWGTGVAVDEYNEMRLKVSSAIQRGDKEGAKRELDAYRTKGQAMNRHVRSKDVSRSLSASESLSQQIEDAFSGPEQGYKQNVMSKKMKSEAFDGRRAGAKK